MTTVRTPAQQKEFAAKLVKAAMFEWVCLVIGVYFLISYFSPQVLVGFGLPILIEGQINIVVFVLAIALGATPLVRVVMSQKERA